MAKFPEIFVIFAAAVATVSSDFPPACLRMLNLNLLLFDCCEYPVIPRQPDVYGACLKACREFDYCCFQECSARESGTFVDGRLNASRVREIFALQRSFGTFVNLTVEWKATLETSVEVCSALETSLEQQQPCEIIYELMACIFRENFLNCPHAKPKAECAEAKVEMEACGRHKGSWRFITDAFNTVKPSFARKLADSRA